jgi:hypothetical protein
LDGFEFAEYNCKVRPDSEAVKSFFAMLRGHFAKAPAVPERGNNFPEARRRRYRRRSRIDSLR